MKGGPLFTANPVIFKAGKKWDSNSILKQGSPALILNKTRAVFLKSSSTMHFAYTQPPEPNSNEKNEIATINSTYDLYLLKQKFYLQSKAHCEIKKVHMIFMRNSRFLMAPIFCL